MSRIYYLAPVAVLIIGMVGWLFYNQKNNTEQIKGLNTIKEVGFVSFTPTTIVSGSDPLNTPTNSVVIESPTLASAPEIKSLKGEGQIEMDGKWEVRII